MATPRQRLLGMPIEQLGFVVALTVKVIAEQELVLATSFVTSHTSTAFTFYMRCIILFSASQRHSAWDIRSENRERASRQKEDAFSCP